MLQGKLLKILIRMRRQFIYTTKVYIPKLSYNLYICSLVKVPSIFTDNTNKAKCLLNKVRYK